MCFFLTIRFFKKDSDDCWFQTEARANLVFFFGFSRGPQGIAVSPAQRHRDRTQCCEGARCVQVPNLQFFVSEKQINIAQVAYLMKCTHSAFAGWLCAMHLVWKRCFCCLLRWSAKHMNSEEKQLVPNLGVSFPNHLKRCLFPDDIYGSFW